MGRQRKASLVFLGLLLASLMPEAATARNMPAPHDGCSLASAAQLRPLIVTGDGEIRATGDHPEPGKLTCAWKAYPKANADAQHDEGAMSLEFYRYGSIEDAKDQTSDIQSNFTVEKLVRTRNADDEIVMPDPGTVIARHDSIITVVHTDQVQEPARAQGDWPYRIQALALNAAGAQVLGPKRGADDTDPDPDACTLAKSSEVLTLITRDDDGIRSQSGHPAPGESTCTWMAYRSGLTADAPPEGKFSLQFYHYADAAKAQAQTSQLSAGTSSAVLVRTADADDAIVRIDRDTVVARHGADIAVAHTDETRDAAKAAADWRYRVQALALTVVGGKVLGPLDARATADACHLLPAEHIQGVLTLTPSALESSLDGNRCFYSVKDASGAISGWVNNRGRADLEIEDRGNHADALKFQHRQTPYFPASDLVTTDDPGDRVVLDGEHPEQVWAVHSSNYVTLSITNVTAAARAHPSWAYRVQRAALEAAGATIVAKAGIAPDPVLPPPVIQKTANTDTQAPTLWAPPPHPAGASAAVLDPLLCLLFFLAKYRFFALPLFILVPIFTIPWLSRRARRSGRKVPGLLVGAIPLCIAFGIVNIVLGTQLVTRLIYHFGVSGSAMVTGEYRTNIQYNDHDVMGYRVMIRTAEGKIVETSFEDDDFTVYPPHNATSYPGPGNAFTARYLSSHPAYFVIVADDDSPWAKGLRCAKLGEAVGDTQQKMNFATGDADIKRAYDEAVNAERQAGCDGS